MLEGILKVAPSWKQLTSVDKRGFITSYIKSTCNNTTVAAAQSKLRSIL